MHVIIDLTFCTHKVSRKMILGCLIPLQSPALLLHVGHTNRLLIWTKSPTNRGRSREERWDGSAQAARNKNAGVCRLCQDVGVDASSFLVSAGNKSCELGSLAQQQVKSEMQTSEVFIITSTGMEPRGPATPFSDLADTTTMFSNTPKF